MKKLTIDQMYRLVDFLIECEQDYEDCYSTKAVNSTLKVLGYDAEFNYVPDENSIRFVGALLEPEGEE